MDYLEHLNWTHMDVLREIGNIGSGNAATALASMLEQRIDMGIPVVRILDVKDASNFLGGPENVLVGILSKLSGEVNGLMMFLVEQDFAQTMLRVLLQEEEAPSDCTRLSELETSALAEIGNILISSYVGSVGTLSRLQIKTSAPAVCVDMVGALLSVPAIQMGAVSDKIIFIENDFLSEQDRMTANMLLVPDMESVEKIFVGLGIQV